LPFSELLQWIQEYVVLILQPMGKQELISALTGHTQLELLYSKRDMILEWSKSAWAGWQEHWRI
jgi:hypothetical protein